MKPIDNYVNVNNIKNLQHECEKEKDSYQEPLHL